MFINTCQISCPKYIQGETNLLLNLHMSKRARLYKKKLKKLLKISIPLKIKSYFLGNGAMKLFVLQSQ